MKRRRGNARATNGAISLFALMVAGHAGSAAAQQAAAAPAAAAPATAGDGIEDIVVTAQRRDERLQSVPVSISAFTGSTLAAAGVNDTTGLQTVTPGLVIGKGLSASTPFIRGIGSSDLGPSNEAGVAIYLDGIYLVASPSALFSLNNIARIEVLKGPQGTLFGRNATGGLIQIVTRTPDDVPSGRFELSYSNYDTVSGTAYLTGGLGAGFTADIAAVASHQGDGWGKNLFDGHDVYRTEEYGVRGKLRWQGATTDVTASLLYIDRNSTVGPSFQPYSPQDGSGAGKLAGNFAFANVGNYNIDSQIDPRGKVKTFIPSLSLTQDLGFANLVSLTSYQKVSSSVFVGQDGVPLQISDGDLHTSSKAGTQEFQLVSPSSGRLKWILGIYGLIRRGSYDPAINYVPTGIIVTNGTQLTHSYAGFGQATLELGPATNVTAGVRYTYDRQEAQIARTFNGFAVGPLSTDQKDYNNVSWRLALDHHFTSDVMAYASYNRGYKSGLFNLLNYPVTSGEARPEKVDAFEAGIKSELFDHKLQLNGSAFLYQYTDLQVFFFLNGSAFTLNADKARIVGLEGELVAKPVRGITLRSGITYLPEAKYTQFSNAPLTTINPVGGNFLVRGDGSNRRISRSPEVTANFGIDYTGETRLGAIDLNLSANYLSRFSWATDARLTQSPYALLNAQARLHLTTQIYAGVFGKNLTNRYYYQYAQSPQTGDVGVPGEPRTYGATLGYTF